MDLAISCGLECETMHILQVSLFLDFIYNTINKLSLNYRKY
jgi:hypothetical protein